MSQNKKHIILNKKKIILRTSAIILIIGSVMLFFTQLNAIQAEPINSAISQTTS